MSRQLRLQFQLKEGLMMIISLFFFLQSSFVVAESSVETEAKKLMGESKRIEALRLLSQKISSNKPDPKTLLLAKQFSQMFITEEAQKSFELAMAKPIEEGTQRADGLFSSMNSEPGNTRVLRALSHYYLRKNQCTEALKMAKKALEIFPFDSAATALNWQALDCLERSDEVYSKIRVAKMKTVNWDKNPMLTIFRARALIQSGKIEDGQAILRSVAQENPKLPEVWFWRWKLDPKDGEIEPSYARKYRSLCQNMSARLNQSLGQYGGFCLHTDRLKDFE